jgi:hypothetical protein
MGKFGVSFVGFIITKSEETMLQHFVSDIIFSAIRQIGCGTLKLGCQDIIGPFPSVFLDN